MLFEKLTDEEKSMIEIFRHNFNEYENTSNFVGEYVDTETFLRFWEEEKASLFEAFGGNLILRKPFQGTVEEDELYEKFNRFFWTEEFSKFRNALHNFIQRNNYSEWYSQSVVDVDGRTKISLKEIVSWHIFTVESFIANTYNGPTVEIKTGVGNVVKLVHGCKLMKVLGRIVKEIPSMTETFEYIRLRQSQIMNEANLKATLCLSIHPLDYMTASYNANGWRSCMNWEDGEFRRGVVEMMNSPLVVVAYLEAEKERLRFGGNLEWNSKRWREFFIVTPEMLSGIKGYPYWNRELEDETLRWLRQIFAPYYNSSYAEDIQVWDTESGVYNEKYNIKVVPCMECGPAMYNDFYDGNDYHSIFVKDLNMKRRFHINYSGASECICCGEDADFDTESYLYCCDCVHEKYCSKCGARLNDDEAIVDSHTGNVYCEYCYDNLPVCDCCHEHTDDYEMHQFVIGRDEDTSDDIIMDSDSIGRRWRGADPVYISVCRECDNEVFVDGSDIWKKPLNHYELWYSSYPIVPLDQLTPWAREHLIRPEDLEYFLTHKDSEEQSA